MKVKHTLGNLSAEKEVSSGDFILTNRQGGFFNSNLKTKQNGWFIFEGEMFKILEGFDNDVSYFENYFYQVNRKGKLLEEYYFPFGKNSLVYGSSGEMEITLDVRKACDERVWGRNYKIFFEDGKTIIKFTKKTDKREDGSNGVKEFEMFVIINDIGEKIGRWVEKEYVLDKENRAVSTSRNVYQAIKFKPGRYVISAGLNKEKVLSQNNFVGEIWKGLREKQKKYFETFLNDELAKFCAQVGLDSLISSLDSKIMQAGLPFSFQEWTRDLLVSSKALMIEGEFDLVKKMLLEQLNLILDDGCIFINKDKNLKSVDLSGWLFFRLRELIKLGKLDSEELKLVKGKLISAIEKMLTYHTKRKLVYTGKFETWMDTDGEREGACIEIQVLRLVMYKLAFELTSDRKYKLLEEEMREEAKKQFWDGEMLVDQLGDLTARPNIFLACYIYPELLSKEEWADAFEYVLERIWLEWGGLATLDIKDKRFAGSYSDEGKFYGRSWFWINNLAAIVMKRVDQKRFSKYISKILKASKNELMWSGCLGGSAELSSADALKSEGCLLQAMGCATLIELMEELS